MIQSASQLNERSLVSVLHRTSPADNLGANGQEIHPFNFYLKKKKNFLIEISHEDCVPELSLKGGVNRASCDGASEVLVTVLNMAVPDKLI